ncbi:MAG: hypothetical protein ABR915_11375, partial [Thermoguttaceae bacterium]
MRVRRTHNRRGVLLLVILGLLAMFAMIAVAFVVLTGHAGREARLGQRVDEAFDPPEKLTDQAARIVFRGSMNQASAVHIGLGEGIYGHETLGARELLSTGQALVIGPPTPVAGGQLLEFAAPPAQLPMYPDAVHRIGCVLT